MPTQTTDTVESLLRDLAAAIASKPDRIKVEAREPIAGEVLFWMSCAPEDQGKLIGRGGSHARAFDLLVAAMGQAENSEWRFKLEKVPSGYAPQEMPANVPKWHDPSPAHELLVRVIGMLPVGQTFVDTARVESPLFFNFDVKASNPGNFFARRFPDDPESTLIGAVGTLFRAAARKAGVRYQINVGNA